MGMRRHGHAVYRDKRWPALRLACKRRDGFRCVKCGAGGPLDPDHIKPIRTHPELAFELSNLQSLCVPCHSRKTAIEVGFAPLDPERQKWRDLLNERNHHA
jgi:5-methylcytosine-specific restriction protein A